MSPRVKSPPTQIAVKSCPLFTKIPVEIRDMIYRRLLISSEPILRAHELIGYKTIVAGNHHPISDLDSRLMMTCRAVYDETLPILYGNNTFEFHSPTAMSLFADSGIPKCYIRMPISRRTLVIKANSPSIWARRYIWSPQESTTAFENSIHQIYCSRKLVDYFTTIASIRRRRQQSGRSPTWKRFGKRPIFV